MNAGSSQIRILTVGDHPVVRQGIAGLLAVQPDMSLVGEASNGREAIQQFRAHRPDVTLMHLRMPRPRTFECDRRRAFSCLGYIVHRVLLD